MHYPTDHSPRLSYGFPPQLHHAIARTAPSWIRLWPCCGALWRRTGGRAELDLGPRSPSLPVGSVSSLPLPKRCAEGGSHW